jgi:hypothetical protein
MSYYDPPTTSFTSKQLIHDLDLLVVDPSGNTYWGNGVEYGDEYNNNEKVMIVAPSAGVYQVYIHAYPLTAADNQPIALVITSGGKVTGPSDASWNYTTADRACKESELDLNVISLLGGEWSGMWIDGVELVLLILA